MEWLVLLAFVVVVLPPILAIWVGSLNARIGRLEQRIAELEASRLESPAAEQAAPAAEDTREPLVLDTPLPPLYFAQRESPAETPPSELRPPEELEPLLLDTPLPPAWNDMDEPPQPVVAARTGGIVVSAVAPDSPPSFRARGFEQWLSERGLAWLGGGALALGIIFFLSFAATQNWFTPTVQLVSALAGAVVLLGLSEPVRRGKNPNPLVAAMLAAGGAVAFYATAWAAYGGYHFIDWPLAAALLTLCALLLVGLSFLHGEALGVLAIIAALLTPAIANVDAWPTEAVTLYVSVVAAGGFALAWLRRWSWTAAVTITGLYFWFAAAIGVDQLRRAMAFLSVASLGAVSLAMRPAPEREDEGTLTWSRITSLGPTIAICVSSVLLLWAWTSVSMGPGALIAGPALIGVFHVALAAYAARARLAAPAAFAVVVGALVAGVVLHLVLRAPLLPGGDVYPSLLAASFAIAFSALAARPTRHARLIISGAGAAGSVLLTLVAATTRSEWHGIAAWAPLFAGAAFLFACAWRATRSAANPQADIGVDAWVAGSAVLLLIGIESAWVANMRVAGDAAAAMLFAAAFAWRGWRATRIAALTAAALSLAHALSPDLISATLSGDIPLWRALLILAAAAAPLYLASLLTSQREPRSATAESLNSAALFLVLVAVFLTLRWFAAGGAGQSLDALSEHGLRVITLLAAGHLLLPRVGAETGLISRWRGHATMAAGIGYMLFVPLLIANPWWGQEASAASGPFLLDSLLLAFAAPAALMFAAANRLYLRERNAARFYAASGGLFAFAWLILELRRGFHAGAMSFSAVGLFEGACYALAFIVLALLVAIVARLREGPGHPFAADLQASTRVLTWGCLLIAAWILLLERNPSWSDAPSDATSRLFAVMAQAWAATLSIALGRALSRTRGVDTTRYAAAAAAAMFTWSFGHAAIHLAPLYGLAPYAHTLWPFVLVIAGAAITARVPGRDTVRAYLDDLEAIWGAAIWPVFGFAALGLWLLFNPWWGVSPAGPESPPLALLGLAAYPAAAWLSLTAPNVQGLRWRSHLARAATIACVVHIFVAITLLVRWVNHGADMAKATSTPLELWSYSAVWALYGGSVLAFGALRDASVLRWSGLALLGVTAIKVFAIDTAQLSGLIRAASLIGLSAVLLLVAWATRRIRQTPPSAS